MKTTAIGHIVAYTPAQGTGRAGTHVADAVEPVALIGTATREDDGSRHNGVRAGGHVRPLPRASLGDRPHLPFLAQILSQRMEPTRGMGQHRTGIASYPSLDLRPETATEEEPLRLIRGGPQGIDVLA